MKMSNTATQMKLQITKASLHCTVGGRNAEYHAAIEEVEGGYLVAVQYGSIGASLQSSKKPAKPVTLEKALALMASVLKEKEGKGYVHVGVLAPMAQVGANGGQAGKERSDHLPQLLNTVDEQTAQLLLVDPDWCMQEKMDGKRITLEIRGTMVRGINKLGFYCGLPGEVVNAALSLGLESAMIDGELIGQTLHAFDLVELGGVDYKAKPYANRLVKLNQLINDEENHESAHSDALKMVFGILCQPRAKTLAFEQLKARGAEGVVFKRLSAPYTPGRPNSGGDQLKLKFTESVSAICLGVNGDKRSVSIGLFDDSGESICVGNVTIPANHPVPQEAQVVEVRYLYFFKGGSLFQPVYLGARDDVLTSECLMSQIQRFKTPQLEV
jgi:bifunctional non-homologous end joining protein LigD